MSLSNAPFLAISGFFTIATGLVVLLIAYFQAKQKKFNRHKNLMIAAVIVNAAFLVQYVTRFLMGDETRFSGPLPIRNFVYLPILFVHISAAIVSIVLILIHLTRSLKNEARSPTNTIYFEKPYRFNHRSFGRITFYIWGSSFVGGIIIFLMLYVLF